jgi:hypothetical protein
VNTKLVAVALTLGSGCGSFGGHTFVYTACDGVTRNLLHPPMEWNHPYGEWAGPTELEAPWIDDWIELMQVDEHTFCARDVKYEGFSCMNFDTYLLEPDCHPQSLQQRRGCSR